MPDNETETRIGVDIALTEGEAKLIDMWANDHGIRTRGGAIRFLAIRAAKQELDAAVRESDRELQ